MTFRQRTQRLQHTIDFSDESTPTRRAKPAHYMLRWSALDATTRCQGVNSRGETGPPARLPLTRRVKGDGPQRTQFAAAKRPIAACQGWSETATATIGA